MLKDNRKKGKISLGQHSEEFSLSDDDQGDLERMDIGGGDEFSLDSKRRKGRTMNTLPGRPRSLGDKFCMALFVVWSGIFQMKTLFQAIIILLVSSVSQFSYNVSVSSKDGSMELAATYGFFMGFAVFLMFWLLEFCNRRFSRVGNDLEFSVVHPLSFLNFFFVLVVLVVTCWLSAQIKATCTDGGDDCILREFINNI